MCVHHATYSFVHRSVTENSAHRPRTAWYGLYLVPSPTVSHRMNAFKLDEHSMMLQQIFVKEYTNMFVNFNVLMGFYIFLEMSKNGKG